MFLVQQIDEITTVLPGDSTYIEKLSLPVLPIYKAVSKNETLKVNTGRGSIL